MEQRVPGMGKDIPDIGMNFPGTVPELPGAA